MTAQKALVVTEQTLDALNEHLAAGWTVVLAAPMGGGGQAAGFASLVVLAPATAVADAILGQIESAIDAAPEAAAVQDPLLRRLQDDADDLGPIQNGAGQDHAHTVHAERPAAAIQTATMTAAAARLTGRSAAAAARARHSA